MNELHDPPATATLKNGVEVSIRAIRADDRDRLLRAFRKLERDTVYTRFFRFRAEPTEEELKRATDSDPEREMALVVTHGAGADETIIGVGRYILDGTADAERSAEVAFTVEEDYQGLGIASLILRHLAAIGRRQKLRCFQAEVLARNASMLRVFARSGLPMKQRRDGGVIHVELLLAESPPRA